MIVMPSLASVAAVALAASISFTSNVTPIGTGAPSHVENRAIGQRSSVESTRGHASAVETRNSGAPSMTTNLKGNRHGNMRDLPVGGKPGPREDIPFVGGKPGPREDIPFVGGKPGPREDIPFVGGKPGPCEDVPPVGGKPGPREDIPSMTDSREGEVSTFQ